MLLALLLRWTHRLERATDASIKAVELSHRLRAASEAGVHAYLRDLSGGAITEAEARIEVQQAARELGETVMARSCTHAHIHTHAFRYSSRAWCMASVNLISCANVMWLAGHGRCESNPARRKQ